MNTLPSLVQFLHRSCFIPVEDIWCKSIDTDYSTTCLGLTYKRVCKHLPKYIKMAKAHLRLSHQHVRSKSDQPPLKPSPQTIH